jgi:hypothetical protein
MDAVFDADDGYMWGVPLHGAFMFADQITRHAVANQADPQGFFTPYRGVYVGILPQNVFIWHTMVFFRGIYWGMMAWENTDPFLSPEYELETVSIMVHEVFHTWQTELFGYTEAQPSQHLNESLYARISVGLEMNALVTALQTTGEARHNAIYTALSLRDWRLQNYPNAAHIENTFKIHEGIPTYVDLVLTFGFDAAVERIIDMVPALMSQSGLPVNFGYVSGALYALLLDAIGADWRGGLRFDTGLGNLLQEAAGIEVLTPQPLTTLDLQPFGYAEVVAAATAWYQHQQITIARARQNFINTPLISVEAAGNFIENLYLGVLRVHGLGLGLMEPGTIFYGTFVHEGSWGRLYINDGMLAFNWDGVLLYSVNATDMETIGNRIIGYDWEIVINDGFHVRERPANFFRVVRQ